MAKQIENRIPEDENDEEAFDNQVWSDEEPVENWLLDMYLLEETKAHKPDTWWLIRSSHNRTERFVARYYEENNFPQCILFQGTEGNFMWYWDPARCWDVCEWNGWRSKVQLTEYDSDC